MFNGTRAAGAKIRFSQKPRRGPRGVDDDNDDHDDDDDDNDDDDNNYGVSLVII